MESRFQQGRSTQRGWDWRRTTTTSYPASRRLTQQCEPMYPAPPVTSTHFPAALMVGPPPLALQRKALLYAHNFGCKWKFALSAQVGEKFALSAQVGRRHGNGTQAAHFGSSAVLGRRALCACLVQQPWRKSASPHAPFWSGHRDTHRSLHTQRAPCPA
jgi:hypothetical protein